MAKKKDSVMPVAGLVVLLLAFIAMAILLISIPDLKESFIGNFTIEQDYDQVAASAVKAMPEYIQYQGISLEQSGKRLVSDGIWEYTFTFDSGVTNMTPPSSFSVKVTVFPGGANVTGFNKISGFCGLSSMSPCAADSDCSIGGCSGQVCQSSNSEPVFSTCEYKDCYNAQQYEVICKCFKGKCQWI